MYLTRTIFLFVLFCAIQFNFNIELHAQYTPVGSGSYTNSFPGVDEASRNSYPSGTPQLSENALGKPVPTNDWWSSLIKNDHVSNLFNYPMALKTTKEGLVVSYIPWGVYDDLEPIVVGLSGLNASKATVADYSDWTVTMDWNDGDNHLQATSGIAMPFLYFTKETDDQVQIKVNMGDVTIDGEMLIVANAHSDADFVIYAPTGSSWSQNSNIYSSSLNNKNYWSMAMLPLEVSNITRVAEEYKKYAYVFPIDANVSWNYDESSAKVTTNFTVETQVKEGTETNMLIGLLPHQWDHLNSGSAEPNKYTYSSVRGKIKTMEGNGFSVENTFQGILPTLPYLDNYSEGFNLASLDEKVKQLENDGLSTWTDSYNEGQMMNRLIQTARIAHEMGNVETRDKIITTIKERLEDWLSAESSEVAFLFYYNSDWSTLIGYPAGHGQDGNINDHHFHWGYFIHAAAFLEQFEPGWAEEWGEMVNHLVRDASSANRADEKFPFLRNFSPYAGHCWANGFATFPQGNDQESTSESMQFHSSLIHWGTVTGNKEVRDLGIYLYTTEQTAIEEYWFDMNERNFSDSQQYSLVSRVWGNSYDNGTFWTSDIAASYGIEMYPIHGGSLYLGQNINYVQKLWNEIENNTGILNNQVNGNLWHDVMWKYLSFIDTEKAIQLYDSYPDRELKFGISDAQTYYWLHSMNAMGQVDISITANYPIACVFNKDGNFTYVAHNYSNESITVLYSDGYELEVPANTMATNRDVDVKSHLSVNFTEAAVNGGVELSLTIESGNASKVEFYDENHLLGEISETPYIIRADKLTAGIHGFYAKIYQGEKLATSNIVKVMVGDQVPFGDSPAAIPGTIDAGDFDKYEGGSGQGIAYSDASGYNEGDYRENEAVDASLDVNEGATIGWIDAGEWLEYTIIVEKSGLYDLSFRFASDISNGGGPFHLELDGKLISEDIYVSSTGGWDKWSEKIIESLPFAGGEHVLRVVFNSGGFNLGRMTFEYKAELPYSQPVANAGEDVIVKLPDNTAMLNGSASVDPGGNDLTYSWEQVYGPNMLVFSDQSSEKPQVSSLEEGVYKVRLTVSNGSYSDDDDLKLIVSTEDNIAPTISITSPKNDEQYIAGKSISIIANASDLDGNVSKVELFVNEASFGILDAEPYSWDWTDEPGEYKLSATATDNEGNTSTSQYVNVILTEAPSCNGNSHNGDYSYQFSDAVSNPALTFIPSESGVGSPTCILYYGTNANGSYPGYNVTPNVPFTITAEEGSTVYFYYTYSYPGQGEKNTADNLLSYVVGTCQSGISLLIYDKTFQLDENSANGTLVGTLNVNYTGDDDLSYSIRSGNEAGAFQINSGNGELSVASSEALDYEVTTSFVLEVQVTDGELTDLATIIINLKDLIESQLSIYDETFYLDENSVIGTLVGTPNVDYTGDDDLTYSILSGNEAGAFQIKSGNGELSVANSSPLDYEVTTSFVLEVQVTDGELTDLATIIINLKDLIESQLSIYDETFYLDENSVIGTFVGTPNVDYTGDDDLNFSILSGNEAGAFQISSENGELSVADSAPLDYESKTNFTLEIQVKDVSLIDQAVLSILLNDVDDIITGIDDIDRDDVRVKVYPNPTSDLLNIDFENLSKKEIRLFNRRGIQVLSKLISSQSTSIDIKQYPSGTYLLNVIGNDLNETIKVMIIK